MQTKDHRPVIFIVSGPAGAGKTTLVNRLFKSNFIRKNFVKSVSYTTRKIRPQEKSGKDYYFVTKEKFLNLKKRKFFLESEKVLDNYYGTPKTLYTIAMKEGKDSILCIDVKGGMYLKNHFQLGKIVTIFISAPTQELCARLNKRAEDKEIIAKRIKLAKTEVQFARYYDYVVINQDIKDTLTTLKAIFIAEKFRRQK